MTTRAAAHSVVLRITLALLACAALVMVAPTSAQAAGWSAWERLDGCLGSSPAAASWGSGRLDVFAVHCNNGSLYHKWYQSGWSGWQSLGGPFTAYGASVHSAPAAVSWGSGRIDVIAAGADRVLYHRFYSGGWSGWDSLGLQILGSPAIASWGPGRLDVFALRCCDGDLMHRSFVSGVGWSAWQDLVPASPFSPFCDHEPAAVSWGANRIDVFSVCDGYDAGMRHNWWDGTRWRQEYLTGGTLSVAGLAVASWGVGRLDVFGLHATNGGIYQRFYSSGWSGWISQGSPPASIGYAPGAVSWGSNRIDLFVTADTLWHKWWG